MIFARSLAGHDKGRLYYVIEETETRVILADGKHKKLECPKIKSKKHVQPVQRLPEEIERQMSGMEPLTNEKIANLLKKYERKSYICQKQM